MKLKNGSIVFADDEPIEIVLLEAKVFSRFDLDHTGLRGRLVKYVLIITSLC
jgi:hypothetical protein